MMDLQGRDVEVYEANIVFGNADGEESVVLRGDSLEDIRNQKTEGVNFENDIGKPVHITTIRDGSIVKITARYRDQVPDILRNTLFIGAGPIRSMVTSILCQQVQEEEIDIDTLRNGIIEYRNKSGTIVRLKEGLEEYPELVGGEL